MDIEKIKQLVKLLETSSLAEVDLKEGSNRIRLRRSPEPPANQNANVQAPTANSINAPHTPLVEPKLPGTVVGAPLVGVFYRKASATSPAFVEIGQRVEKGDVLCIVEAMKMMNNVEATCAGVIEAVMVEDGQPVEYDQPLFTIV
ncbi:acetyl-CoA carboxylase biotin carboxyl carrier protein subunit [Paucimonas lemoignei]|jgi:acetyl-CoA carboxylase biotin carboxyl carrier protein|nr:acetyl-CoA carboxylase biotin carboxyl carrier protein subunit [Paucimonas lemoignei]